MENLSADYPKNSKEELESEIKLLQEKLDAQAMMLEDALEYAVALEKKIQLIISLSCALQSQITDLKSTADTMHLQATILA